MDGVATTASMESAAAFAAKAAIDAGNAMEAAFSSAKASDRDGALDMAKEAATKAILAKKALALVLHGQSSANVLLSRVALGHVEDARLFAKAAMDVSRAAARRINDRAGGEPARKSAEALAFLMASASALLDVKRGANTESTLRKAAMASERAALAADEAAKIGGAGNGYADDARAAKETAAEIARRALWAVREATK
jgi:hypothetical protein